MGHQEYSSHPTSNLDIDNDIIDLMAIELIVDGTKEANIAYFAEIPFTQGGALAHLEGGNGVAHCRRIILNPF